MLVILLLRPLMRAIAWVPLLVTGVVAVVMICLIDTGSPLDSGTSFTLLRMMGMLLGAAAGFTVLDEMEATTAASPVSRGLRHRMRYLGGGLIAGGWWTTTYAIAVARLPEGGVLRLPGMAVEAATCIVAGLLAVSVATRIYQGKAAALAGMGGLLAALSITLVLRGPYWPWLYPDKPTWEAVHYGWTAALVLLLIALDVIGQGPRRTR